MKSKICAYICVYNEEARIGYTLNSFKWCDQIIVVDKNSNDHTREIASSFGVELYLMDHKNTYNASDDLQFLENCRCEWLMLVTASDIISPKLANQIKEIVDDNSSYYDSISIPYHRYVLGIYNKRSPWYSGNLIAVYKRSAVRINTSGVHDGISINHKSTYVIKFVGDNALLHLTHERVDTMMERHLRYIRTEGINYSERSMFPALKSVLRSFFDCFLSKKSFFCGWDGIALMFSYLSYHMLSFVYKWENNRSHAIDVYHRLREQNSKDWEMHYKNSEAEIF